jgi:hypothetical protein
VTRLIERRSSGLVAHRRQPVGSKRTPVAHSNPGWTGRSGGPALADSLLCPPSALPAHLRGGNHKLVALLGRFLARSAVVAGVLLGALLVAGSGFGRRATMTAMAP